MATPLKPTSAAVVLAIADLASSGVLLGVILAAMFLGQAAARHQIANRWANRFAHQVLVNVDSLAELLENTEGVARDRIAYIPNFVEEHAFQDLSALERAEWRRRVDLPASATIVGTPSTRPRSCSPSTSS